MSCIDTSKLKQLRAKTDRQLVHLIRNRLERAFVSTPEDSVAEQARCEVHAWLPMVPAPDRVALEPMLAQLDRRSQFAICQGAGA